MRVKTVGKILRRDLHALVGLAWPIILSRLGIVVLFLVDFLMVGRYSADHIGYLGLGMTPATVFVPLIIGLLMGTLVLVTRAYGARRFLYCGEVWRQSLPYAMVIGLLGGVFCAAGEWLLLLSGQEAQLAYEAGQVSLFGALGIPFLTLGMTSGFFLEAIGRVRTVMLAMLVANLLNVVLNYLFIFGHFGFPEMGAAGAALATSFARTIQTVCMISYIWFMRDQAKFGVRVRPKPNPDMMREHRRIGYAGGISIGLEHLAFATLTIFAGWLGTLSLAAHTITFNFFGLCFMLGLGIGTATSVRVGHAFGAGKYKAMRRIMWFGLVIQAGVMLALAVISYMFGTALAGLYTPDAAVILLAGTLIGYVAFSLWLDTGQILMSQCLRVMGDVWTPSYIHMLSYLVLMLPGAWILTFPLGRGVMGLVDGFYLGCISAFVLAFARVIWLTRRAAAHRQSFASATA